MKNMIRFALVLVALSMLVAPIHILLMWPRLPTSFGAWAALLILPLPLAALSEWLFQYRDIRLLRPIDKVTTRAASSLYSLSISVTCVLIVGVAAFALLFFFTAL